MLLVSKLMRKLIMHREPENLTIWLHWRSPALIYCPKKSMEIYKLQQLLDQHRLNAKAPLTTQFLITYARNPKTSPL